METHATPFRCTVSPCGQILPRQSLDLFFQITKSGDGERAVLTDLSVFALL